jgi:plasmid stabilization system protein ParE
MIIRWIDKALNDLQTIYDYIYTQSPHNAEKVIDSVLILRVFHTKQNPNKLMSDE